MQYERGMSMGMDGVGVSSIILCLNGIVSFEIRRTKNV